MIIIFSDERLQQESVFWKIFINLRILFTFHGLMSRFRVQLVDDQIGLVKRSLYILVLYIQILKKKSVRNKTFNVPLAQWKDKSIGYLSRNLLTNSAPWFDSPVRISPETSAISIFSSANLSWNQCCILINLILT